MTLYLLVEEGEVRSGSHAVPAAEQVELGQAGPCGGSCADGGADLEIVWSSHPFLSSAETSPPRPISPAPYA